MSSTTKGKGKVGAKESKSKPEKKKFTELEAKGPSSKKVKTGLESLEQFLERIKKQRETAGVSVETFKFEKKRCRTLTKSETLPKEHSGILYWMSRDQRVQDNWALLYAQRLALKEKVPLFVCFCLVPKFLQATLRQYAFMLKGLIKVREELHSLNIPFHFLLGEAKNLVPEFVQKNKCGGVVTDFSPLRVPQGWAKAVADKLPKDVPLCQVDAHNVIPVWVTSEKLEYAARTIRTKIDRNMAQYLTEFPPVLKHLHHNPSIDLSSIPNPLEDWNTLLKFLEIDKSIEEVDWAQPGTPAGLSTLHTFLESRIQLFGSKRNDPNVNALSNLSPWFHFGQLSVARAILEVKKSPYSEGAKAFIEEAVVRRELSDNFCFYNNDKYDSLEGANDWARKTLNDHRKDKRKPLYGLKELEQAKTYDELWNGCQNQMRIEGKMHGFMRMYWAKKILEWTESPEKALEIAIYLNDKYNLDGRDPNGYVGCMWSICGIHDQGWREREIFGKIRYMNYEGCKRKFDINSYSNKYNKLAKDKKL